MTKFERIKKEWGKAFAEMNQSEGFSRLMKGDVTKEHYVQMVKQLYLQVRENSSLQAMCTNRFKGPRRSLVSMFLKHALSEVGHEQLIADDLRAMGVDITNIECQRPLPSIIAMIAFPHYLITHENPISYIGFVFHLEFMPTAMGWSYIENLKKIGIPENAMSFIAEHAEVDVAHNKLMERYIDELIVDEKDLEDVIYAARVGARYYGNAVTEIIAAVDKGTIDWGIDQAEVVSAKRDSSIKKTG